MNIGDLVKAKPGTTEGVAESIGLGLVITKPIDDGFGKLWCRVQWIKSGKTWFFYVEDLEIVNAKER